MSKKTKKIPVEVGVCPKCGGELHMGPGDLEGEVVGYQWDCLDCKATGMEWYRMEFSSHALRTKAGGYKFYRAVKEPIVIVVKGGVATCEENPTENPVVIRDLD